MQKLRVAFVISPIVATNICNILSRPAASNKLITVKLKQDLKYKGYVYFESVHPNVIYQALNYLKLHNKFYEDISILGLSSKDMRTYSGIDEYQDVAENIHKKSLQVKQNMIQLRIH